MRKDERSILTTKPVWSIHSNRSLSKLTNTLYMCLFEWKSNGEFRPTIFFFRSQVLLYLFLRRKSMIASKEYFAQHAISIVAEKISWEHLMFNIPRFSFLDTPFIAFPYRELVRGQVWDWVLNQFKSLFAKRTRFMLITHPKFSYSVQNWANGLYSRFECFRSEKAKHKNRRSEFHGVRTTLNNVPKSTSRSPNLDTPCSSYVSISSAVPKSTKFHVPFRNIFVWSELFMFHKLRAIFLG